MKRFLKNTIFFFLLMMLLAEGLDYFFSVNLGRSKTFALGECDVWNDINKGRVNADMLVYGSSRAWVHIDPEMLKDSFKVSAYNLGIDGHNFWLQYLRHKELLRYNKVPRFIIFSVDIFTLQKQPDLYNAAQFLPFMLFNKDIYDYTSSYKGYSFFDYSVPLYRYAGKRELIKQAIDFAVHPDTAAPMRINGYRGQDKSWNNDFEKAKASMEYYEIKIDSPTVALFNRFLAECKAKNIEIVFVYTPEYIEGQRFVKDREKLIALYEGIARRNNIQFLDYSADSICQQQKYFYNAMHLNREGAELFTRKLIHDIKARHVFPGLNLNEH